MRRQIAYAQPAPLSDRRNRQAEQGYQATSKSENFSPRRDVKDYGPGVPFLLRFALNPLRI
eukprot:scaffold3157_cov16-Tisochrysis_lutea.AAC.1